MLKWRICVYFHDQRERQLHDVAVFYPRQHATTRCNTLQHTAAHCNTLQHAATHCNTLQQVLRWLLDVYRHDYYEQQLHGLAVFRPPQHTATHCNTLQHTATGVTMTVMCLPSWSPWVAITWCGYIRTAAAHARSQKVRGDRASVRVLCVCARIYYINVRTYVCVYAYRYMYIHMY